jgi:hypothetical protein
MACRRLVVMSMHRKTLPLDPRPRYLITMYWLMKVQLLIFVWLRLLVSLQIQPDGAPGRLGRLKAVRERASLPREGAASLTGMRILCMAAKCPILLAK